jgi:hypothetical protein
MFIKLTDNQCTVILIPGVISMMVNVPLVRWGVRGVAGRGLSVNLGDLTLGRHLLEFRRKDGTA